MILPVKSFFLRPSLTVGEAQLLLVPLEPLPPLRGELVPQLQEPLVVGAVLQQAAVAVERVNHGVDVLVAAFVQLLDAF